MVSPASTSLTLRALLKAAARRADLGAPSALVSGLSSSAKAFFVAVAAADAPVILVVPTDRDVEQQVSDIRFFLACLEGLPHPEAEQSVLPFPSHEIDPYRGLAPHFDVASARGRVLHALATGTARVVVASVAALLPRVSGVRRLLAASIALSTRADASPTRLADLLADAGFTREDPVDQHGTFCVRGGLLDFFQPGDPHPIRIEFIGDMIESIRRYDPATQRSIASLDQTVVVPIREVFEEPSRADSTVAAGVDRASSFFDYLAHGRPARILVSESADVATHGARVVAQVRSSYDDALGRGQSATVPAQLLVEWSEVERWLGSATHLEQLGMDGVPGAPPERRSHRIPCQPAVEFRGRLSDWIADVRRARGRGETVLLVAATPGRAERIGELLAEHELLAVSIDRADDSYAAAVLVATGHLTRGFRLPTAALQIYAEADLFAEEHRVHERRRSPAGSFLSGFRDLKVGDFVVHIDHGIGVFVGLREIGVGLEPQDFMELRYAGNDKLFVPIEQLDLVQKYTGGARPALERLGGASWDRAKTKVRRAMRDMAEELLRLYAARKAMAGHAFSPDAPWQREFEDGFDYGLTPDQETATADIKRDMESPFPMDRLLCGDVGYGKTEVAMRAAFKAVMDGKQVAVLAPTTVLTFQHLKTLTDRFAAFPVRVEMISRFRTRVEQKQTLADLADGKVEIVVGTHRLLSKDVRFKDLGLLVVDEEQRFGVAHKERIKQLRRRVDVLTMTATPIPRTLNMALVGIRDMSVIETAPQDRLAIQTNVIRFDPQVIAGAIRTELARGGQVYFVHNRVGSIASIANLLTRLVPEARVGVAHGQNSEAVLERCMIDFVAHKFDVLLATTIIENGLDIPNANTIVVNHAEKYGLSELYQLRGRVGRSDRRAYAYLVVPPAAALSAIARKRLAAIKEFSDLGSGFRVAALDLEIRGAGNLLGSEQSGQIEAVGFDMYIKLLEQTVRELKGEEIEDEIRAAVNLKVDLRIDEQYIPDMNQRLSVYRRVAATRTESEIDRLLEEMADRYGPVLPSLLNLAEYGRIRLMADHLGVEALDRDGQILVLRFRSTAPVDPVRLIRFVQDRPDVTLTPPAVLRINLRQPVPSRAERSWWTARATAGEVKPGFTRAEILKPGKVDPRGAEGIFGRVVGLLAELSRDG